MFIDNFYFSVNKKMDKNSTYKTQNILKKKLLYISIGRTENAFKINI